MSAGAVPRPASVDAAAGPPARRDGDPTEVCPHCGAPLAARHCKVFCTGCGLLVYNCSEF